MNFSIFENDTFGDGDIIITPIEQIDCTKFGAPNSISRKACEARKKAAQNNPSQTPKPTQDIFGLSNFANSLGLDKYAAMFGVSSETLLIGGGLLLLLFLKR